MVLITAYINKIDSLIWLHSKISKSQECIRAMSQAPSKLTNYLKIIFIILLILLIHHCNSMAFIIL